MIVYHGSNRNFKTLRISKSLVRYDSTLENEGIGIYFSTDKDVAMSYGKYLYVLEVNDKYFYDFRKMATCKGYIDFIRKSIYKDFRVDIGMYADLTIVTNYMNYGGIAISGVGKELCLQLDSVESWYHNVSPTLQSKIFSALRRYDKNCPKAYMFNYNIKNCGVIKDVSEDIVKIVEKRRL